MVGEPDSFAYTPGRGVSAIVGGKSVSVGNRALMRDIGVAVTERLATETQAASEALVARDGISCARSWLPTACARRHAVRLRRSIAWAFERSS